MARKRDPRRDEALEIFKQHNGDITNRSIANQLDVPEKTISAWKSRDKWNEVLHGSDRRTTKEKRSTAKRHGAPKGNKNAVGNQGGPPKGNKNAVGHGAPLRNENAVTHGFFRKHLPHPVLEIVEQMRENELNMLDLLWMSIEMKFATIMYSHKIMFVESKDELIKEIKKQKFEVMTDPDDGKLKPMPVETELEFQWSWDRQATFINAQSRAMAELRNLFKDYMIHSGEDDKRRLEIEKMQKDLEKAQLEIQKLSSNDKDQPIEVVIKRKSNRVGVEND